MEQRDTYSIFVWVLTTSVNIWPLTRSLVCGDICPLNCTRVVRNLLSFEWFLNVSDGGLEPKWTIEENVYVYVGTVIDDLFDSFVQLVARKNIVQFGSPAASIVIPFRYIILYHFQTLEIFLTTQVQSALAMEMQTSVFQTRTSLFHTKFFSR